MIRPLKLLKMTTTNLGRCYALIVIIGQDAKVHTGTLPTTSAVAICRFFSVSGATDMRNFVNRIHRVSASCSELITNFITENGAQDMVEYALLAAFIGIAGWAVLLTLPDVIG